MSQHLEDLTTHLTILSKLPMRELRIHTGATCKDKAHPRADRAVSFNTCQDRCFSKFHVISDLYKTVTWQAVV